MFVLHCPAGFLDTAYIELFPGHQGSGPLSHVSSANVGVANIKGRIHALSLNIPWIIPPAFLSSLCWVEAGQAKLEKREMVGHSWVRLLCVNTRHFPFRLTGFHSEI